MIHCGRTEYATTSWEQTNYNRLWQIWRRNVVDDLHVNDDNSSKVVIIEMCNYEMEIWQIRTKMIS